MEATLLEQPGKTTRNGGSNPDTPIIYREIKEEYCSMPCFYCYNNVSNQCKIRVFKQEGKTTVYMQYAITADNNEELQTTLHGSRTNGPRVNGRRLKRDMCGYVCRLPVAPTEKHGELETDAVTQEDRKAR